MYSCTVPRYWYAVPFGSMGTDPLVGSIYIYILTLWIGFGSDRYIYCYFWVCQRGVIIWYYTVLQYRARSEYCPMSFPRMFIFPD